MKAVLDIADAIVAELNNAAGGTFSLAFTATRHVLPRMKIENLDELKVTVAPKAADVSRATRTSSQYDLSIDIGIQKKLGRDLDDELPPLAELVEAVADYLTGKSLAAAPWAQWLSIENNPIYDPGHLGEQRVYTSVLTVTYRAVK